VLFGIALPTLPAIVLAVATTIAAIVASEAWERRRIRRLTAQLNAWLGAAPGPPSRSRARLRGASSG
jgi:hypothetical protein